jgi:menaquinone-dependent protoporphyrinogen oxidase
MKPMRELADRISGEVEGRPVWLFSSGPIGDPPKPEEDPVDVAAITEATGARDHFVIAGKLDKKVLNFGERAIVTALKAPEGDFRDWDQIREYAARIAEDLRAKV